VETTLSVSGHFRTRSITLDTRERLETRRYFKSWSLPSRFLRSWPIHITDSMRVELTGSSETQTDDEKEQAEAHSFKRQLGIGSESDWVLIRTKRILEISDSDAGLKVKDEQEAKLSLG